MNQIQDQQHELNIMNDYFFTEEHGLIRDLVSDFANTKLSPLTTKMDKEDYFPIELFYELGKLGFLAPSLFANLMLFFHL